MIQMKISMLVLTVKLKLHNYNSDQIGVNEEIDRDISSECKHNFKNNRDICK